MDTKSDRIYTMGIDVGGSYVKGVILHYSQHIDDHRILTKRCEKIRKRNPLDVSSEIINDMLSECNLHSLDDISYLASTGEGEMVEKKTGHFYSMTTHSRGGKFFLKEAKTVVDMGALYVRAISVNDQGRVMDYKMTGQCASGSGQFIENISRYLGLSVEEVGGISLKADNPETPSGICAVLAETDVINLVSKGLSTPNIMKGIHLSVANRIVKLLGSLKAESPIVLVGGMAMNVGMVQAIKEIADESKYNFNIQTSPDAIYSGALGAALWGGFRYFKIKDRHKESVI